MIINNSTPYPIFTKGQQLKSTSLKGIVDFAELEIKDTRILLEGSGIFYGLEAIISKDAGTIRLTPGTAVTSDGKLFSLDNEITYNGYSADIQIPLFGRSATVSPLITGDDNHAQLIHRLGGNVQGNPNPDPVSYMIILYMTSSDTSEPNCLYGYESNESTRTQVVNAALIDKDFFTQAELDAWFINDISEAGKNDPIINRFGYKTGDGKPHISFADFTSWDNVRDGFNNVCEPAETLIGDAFIKLYKLVKEKLRLPEDNPFDGLAADLTKLRLDIYKTGGRLLPWLYDYYRDLIATYQEFVSTDLFSNLSLFPKRDRFPDYISVGSVRAKMGDRGVELRMGLYRPPFTDLSINALERPQALMDRMKYLAVVANTYLKAGFPEFSLSITPDAGLNKPLSERSIPFYYKDPATLAETWNADLKRNRRTFTILGVTDEDDRKAVLANIDNYTFFRIKGHTGKSIKETQDAIEPLRSELHLPFDIRFVYLGTDDDMIKLIKERSATFSDLTIMLDKIVNDIRCNHTCGDNLEETVFNGEYNSTDPGTMFEALVELFGAPLENPEEKIDEICSREGVCYDEDKTCCRAHLTSLYAVCKEYVRRKDELAGNLLFHRFAQQHPGLEHNGGVPKGGTLVLVCEKITVDSLPDEKKDNLVKLLLSNSKEDKAAGINLAEELQGYNVVADFSLPYICCSGQPSINLIFQEAPPVARFTIANQEPIPEKGAVVDLKNISLRADTYHWVLKDYQGDIIKEQDTTDLNENVKFELLNQFGVVFNVELTASREGMDSKYSVEITICPSGKVQVTSNESSSVDWDITESNEIGVEAFPYGGSFSLILRQNDTERDVDPSEYDISWNEDRKNLTLSVDKPELGIYQLTYFFDIEKCEGASAVLDIHTFVPNSNGPRVENLNTNTNPVVDRDIAPAADAAALNKRILSYRSGINAMSKEDESLLEDTRWSDTKTFLLASGAPEELHAGYEKLQSALQTGFSKLKVAQKAQVIRMLIYATAYYIDRLIAASPDKVPSIARKLIKSAAESIAAQKDGVAQWEQIWNAKGISTSSNEKTVSAYKALIA